MRLLTTLINDDVRFLLTKTQKPVNWKKNWEILIDIIYGSSVSSEGLLRNTSGITFFMLLRQHVIDLSPVGFSTVPINHEIGHN